MDDNAMPDPGQITDLTDLARALATLRRRRAREGQIRLSIRDLAARTGRPASTLHPYLRGQRLCPADVYEDLLRALGVPNNELRPWLDAWDRIADTVAVQQPTISLPAQGRRHDALERTERIHYQVLMGSRPAPTVTIIAGSLRRVVGIDVWVNSENSRMQMSRFDEYSVSAIIRFEGAVRDDAGHVVDDRIADALATKVAGRIPVAAGAAIVTTAGELTRRNAVRYIIHVAAVQGEPGDGYRQILDVGRCVTNALVEAERLGAPDHPVRSILFPLLGTGVGGGDVRSTVRAMLGAAIDYLTTRSAGHIQNVCLLASTQREFDICRSVFSDHPHLRPDMQRSR